MEKTIVVTVTGKVADCLDGAIMMTTKVLAKLRENPKEIKEVSRLEWIVKSAP